MLAAGWRLALWVPAASLILCVMSVLPHREFCVCFNGALLHLGDRLLSLGEAGCHSGSIPEHESVCELGNLPHNY